MLIHRPRVRLTPEKMIITKLTDEATVSHAALSPDGRYVAYISRRGTQPTLWLRQVAAQSAVQLLPSLQQAYDWVGFSPDGESILLPRQSMEMMSICMLFPLSAARLG